MDLIGTDRSMERSIPSSKSHTVDSDMDLTWNPMWYEYVGYLARSYDWTDAEKQKYILEKWVL